MTLLIALPGDWITRAACRHRAVNPDWWTEPGQQGLGRHICRSHCPVKAACAAWAAGGSWYGAVVGGELRQDDGQPSNWQPALTRAGCPTCGIPAGPPPRDLTPRQCRVCRRTVGCRRNGLLAPHRTDAGDRCPGDGSRS